VFIVVVPEDAAALPSLEAKLEPLPPEPSFRRVGIREWF
jgi:hypothetical protein